MLKRMFDFAVAFTLLMVLLPVVLVVAVLVRIFLGSPVLFVQQRPGLNGRGFHIYKFRTMLDARCANGELLDDAARLTSFGRLLRTTSLDELPQLLNVLKGDISLVGPRPLLTEYLPLYTTEQARRHEVRPGITGWAQVNGRNAISWDEKLDLDVWYVEHRSFWLDLKILALTAKKVFLRADINAVGDATVSKFEGSKR
ncbi:sugar transferase [Massilia sp. GCM10023247]|uniref:sugar transferase n=1 Tax=Massilia sp. GCM10023247 TaxID=3252643 RepID=UPI00360D02D8